MARAASTDGHDETSSYESSSCQPSCRPGVTPLLCIQVHCTSTSQLASSCLQMFLNWASVSRFKAALVPVPQCQSLARCCQDQDFQVEARAGDVMAGACGAAGPAPDVRHQPPGDAKEERGQTNVYSPGQRKKQYRRVDARSTVIMPVESMHEITV